MEAKVEQLNYYCNPLSTAEQNSVVQLPETIIQGKNEMAERISIEQYNIEIEAALLEAERGETLLHEEVITLSKQ